MWKTHKCSLLDSGDVVYRHILQLGDRATLSIAGSEMAKDIGLDLWEWAMCSLLSHGLMLSGRSWWLVAGPFWFKTRLLLVDLIWSMFTLLQGFVDIFSGFGISLPCLRCASWSGLLKRHLSRQQSHCCGLVSGAGKGNGGVIFNSAQYFATVIFAPIMGWLRMKWAGHTSSSLWAVWALS